MGSSALKSKKVLFFLCSDSDSRGAAKKGGLFALVVVTGEKQVMKWMDTLSGMSMAEVLGSPAFLFFSVIAPFVITAIIFWSRKPRKPRDPTIKKVTESQITALIIYPIKSCGGIPYQKWDYDVYGLKWDRRWMLVTKRAEHASADDDDKPEFKMLSQRQNPKMALFKPKLTKDKLIITAPGKKSIEVLQLSSWPRLSYSCIQDFACF